MDEKTTQGWRRKWFKGNKVWMEADESGLPLIKGGKVRIKYQLDQPHEYRVHSKDLRDIEDGPDKKKTPPLDGATKSAEKSDREKLNKETNDKEAIIIYTDGASSGNPGPAGIGIVLMYGGHRKEISRYIGIATNNVAELEAVRVALLSLNRKDLAVRIHTDSKYVWGLLEKGWQAKKNPDLVSSIRELIAGFDDVKFFRVQGHSGVAENERADRLAVRAIEGSGEKK